MKKYRCNLCGYIYEETEKEKFDELSDNYVCPICMGKKSNFEQISEIMLDKAPVNAVKIDKSNPGIIRAMERCINCGICTQTCVIREGMSFNANSELCLSCGQCIQTCPAHAILPKPEYSLFRKAKADGKICIAYTSPAIRVALKEAFPEAAGRFEEAKIVGLLKLLGFDYVFDTTLGADITIMEEASELIDRIKNNKNIPMFTSCCPSWVKYASQFYPELLENISTCKSPIAMLDSIVREYLFKNSRNDSIYTVAITPCTAKKYEIKRDAINKTSLVLTISEILEIIKNKKIKYQDIPNKEYDELITGSGAGLIFGNTGGVAEAAVRTAYYLMTNKDLERDKLQFSALRGYENVKEATVDIDGIEINICVIHQMSSAKEILEQVKAGKSKYHFIEIMNCKGGCIGGGGQPKIEIYEEDDIKKERINSLYQKDDLSKVRCSYKNEVVQKIYDEFLEKPLSKKAHELLHTTYKDNSDVLKNSIDITQH